MVQSEADRLRGALGDVARRARDLPWAKERCWTPASHVWSEGEVLVLDLHDLSVRLGVLAVEEVAGAGVAAVVLVTGRGRHSIGPSRLRQAVFERVGELCGELGGTVRPQGPGRLLWVLDPERAPATAAGRLPALFWLFVALVLLGVLSVLWRAIGGG